METVEWGTVATAYLKAGEKILGYMNYERKEWILESTQQLVLTLRGTRYEELKYNIYIIQPTNK